MMLSNILIWMIVGWLVQNLKMRVSVAEGKMLSDNVYSKEFLKSLPNVLGKNKTRAFPQLKISFNWAGLAV